MEFTRQISEPLQLFGENDFAWFVGNGAVQDIFQSNTATVESGLVRAAFEMTHYNGNDASSGLEFEDRC